MAWTITIPDFIPARVNQLYSGHWAKRLRLKAADAEMIAGYARKAQIPKATGRRQVHLELTLTPRMRGTDKDAFWKSVLDSLVHCEMLVDDNAKYCEPATVQFTRGPKKQTVILLEDLEA